MKEQNFNEQEHGFRSKFKNKLKTDESLYIASEQRDYCLFLNNGKGNT